MKSRNQEYLGVMVLVLFGLVLGCAADGKHGKFRATHSGIEIAYLQENWKDYNVYWTGVDPAQALGIVFDPKNDDKKLQFGSSWEPVKDQKQLADLISVLEGKQATPMFDVLYLRDILDPTGQQLYGYVYTYDILVETTVIDAKTMSIEIPFRY